MLIILGLIIVLVAFVLIRNKRK
ncbi:hypothetical protein ACVRWE_03520 [Streptococcus urinalis]